RYGRKVTMAVGDLVLMTGAALVAGARNEGMLLFGRVLCGLGVALCQGSFAGWAVELASARTRGAAVCIVQVSYNLGVFIAFWVSLGTTKIPGTDAWRTLVALQVILGILLGLATFFAPESPRMLLSLAKDPSDAQDGKVVKARSNLCTIRRLRDSDPELLREWNELQAAAEVLRATKADYALTRLIRSRGMWRRIAIGAGSCVFAQLTGVAALMLYGITVFESLKLGGSTLPLITNGVSGSIQLIACFFAVFFVDRLGRRRVMIVGLIVACVGYLFLGALFEKWPQATNKGAGIWMVICIFAIQCSYAGAMGPIAYLIAAEIWPQPLRELGISISLLSLFIAVIVVNQLWPVLTDLINYRLYWIMLGVNVVTLTLVWRFWPETKGRTLEEMDSLF
ncbi:MFS general substrate transporter, partial [Jaminaea rosea]